MKITEVIIHPSYEDPVGAYVTIVFDNCFLVRQIKSHGVRKGREKLAAPFQRDHEGEHFLGCTDSVSNQLKRRSPRILGTPQVIAQELWKSFLGYRRDQTAPPVLQGFEISRYAQAGKQIVFQEIGT